MSNDQTTPLNPKVNTAWHESQAIIQAFPDYLFWKGTGPKYAYQGCNFRFAELVGLEDPSKIEGLTDWDLPWQPAGHRPDFFRQGDEDTLTGRQAITNQIETLVLPHQPPRLLSVTKRPLCDHAGKITGVLGVARDVTASINTHALVRNLFEQDHWIQTTQRERLSLLAHRLRTPLNGLITGCDTLSAVLEESRHHVTIEGMKQAGHTLLAQINQLIGALSPHEIKPEHISLAAQKNPIITSTVQRAPNVLIVEDYELMQWLLLRLFESQGAQVTVMSSAETALTACLETVFDLVITDISLPGQSGVQFAEQVKQLAPHQRPKRLIGLSAHMDAILKQDCLRSGMYAAFQKPLSRAQVNTLLEDISRTHQPTDSITVNRQKTNNATQPSLWRSPPKKKVNTKRYSLVRGNQ